MALVVGSLYAILRLDRDDFDRDLERAKQDMRRLGNTAEQQGQRVSSSFNGLSTSFRRETDQAEGHMRRLGQSGEQAGRNLGQGIQSGAESGMRGIGGIGQNAGAAAGAGVEGGMAGKLAGLGRAAGPVGMAIMGIAAVGAVVGAKLAENIMAGLEKQALANKDRARFGWTEAQAAEAGKAAAASYTSAWGESVAANRAAVGTAIQAGLIDGDATAEQIQPVIDKLNIVTEIMGTDIPETARTAGQMVRTGMSKDTSEALDLLTAAQQHGLNVSGDLLDTITEYGTQFRKVGFDGATALGLVQQMMQAGARDTDVAADALKEFSIRAVDGSKETTAAFEMLGYNAYELAERFSKGGQTARDAFQEVVGKIQGIQDPLTRARVETSLFGTQAEDLGAALNGIDTSTAAQQFGVIAGAADRAGGTLHSTSSDIEAAKRSIEVSMDNIQVKLAEAFGPSLAQAAQWVSDHTEEISRAFEIVGGTIGMVAGALGVIGGTIVGVVGEVIEHTAKLIRGVLGPIFTGMEKLGGAMAKMPGAAGEMGRALQNGAAAGRTWIDTWVSAGEATSDFGWDMARAGGAIGEASADIAKGTDKAKTATEAFQGLGIKVREVPDEKRIVIEDNSPETKAKLEELGIKVQTLPDGSLYIDTDDEDAKAKIAELTKPEVKTIVVTTTQAKIGEELAAVNKIRQANGMAPLTSEQFGTGSVGAGVNGTGTGTQGQKVTVKVTDGPAKVKPTSQPTQIHKTTEELEDEQKAKDKADKTTAAAKAKAAKDQAAAAKKASDAAAKIPGLETSLAIAEQKVRELKPNASTSSRMSAEQAVTKARDALTKARADAQGATTTTTTGTDGKPVTVTGDGKGGTVQVGTGNNPLQVEPANSAQGDGMRVFVTNMPAGGVGGGIKLSLFANGGVEDHTAQIARGGDMRVWAEPETEGEAYIPLARSKRGRSMGILRQVAARFGQRLTAYEDGGITNGLQSGAASLRQIIMDQFGITDIGGYRAADGYNEHSTGRALDVMVNDVAKGTAVKDFVVANAKALGLKWAIWQQAMWYPDGSTTPMEDRGSPTQNHMDHVHVFLDESSNGSTFSLDGAGGTTAAQLAQVGSLTAQSSKEQVAAAVISEGRKRGLTDVQIRAVLATMLTENRDFDPSKSGGVQGSAGEVLGLFQQGNGYTNATDPNEAIKQFYDRLGETTGDDIYQRITGVQQHGGAYQGTGGDQAYMDLLQGNATAADELFSKVVGSLGTGSALTTNGTGTKTTTGTGSTQNVYVTGGKLDSLGTGGGSQFKFSLFANGGIEDHTAHITDKLRVFGEPETGGEAYIPLAASKRARSLAIWRRTGQLLGVQGYAGGGINIAPKIEAPKITPTVGPGMALPIPAATPTVGTGTGTGASFDPLAALGLSGLGAGVKQEGVGGTSSAQEYQVQRLIQYGGDMAKVLMAAGKEIALPSGLDSQQAQNVLGLIKGVGSGISSSAQKAESTRTTKSGDGKNVTITNNHTWNVSSADEAYRNLKRDEGRKALTYDGSLV